MRALVEVCKVLQVAARRAGPDRPDHHRGSAGLRDGVRVWYGGQVAADRDGDVFSRDRWSSLVPSVRGWWWLCGSLFENSIVCFVHSDGAYQVFFVNDCGHHAECWCSVEATPWLVMRCAVHLF
ncbi:phage DNA packaging protein J [Rothia kristinae]|uniref:Phage DNA packaging protein J n=1 Tax=Rothia kristinae TaxID=37923 RepID=A0A7T3CFE3_9MICC|nr:phage DNA packaging protein J [Rothia kristinae]